MMPEVSGMDQTDEIFDIKSIWGMPLEPAVCEQCDWSFLYSSEGPPPHCPHCYKAELVQLSGQVGELPYPYPPELLLPFTLTAGVLEQGIHEFAARIPLAPYDLTPQNLLGRMHRIYLPMWLVDAQVTASWQAETGFNYEVVSHQERYDERRGGWLSQKTHESRIRWEPRLGNLNRSYLNIAAPAIEADTQIKNLLGDYDLKKVQPYRPEAVEQAFVRLPNRSPDDAWSDAALAFQKAAAQECRLAAKADHIRQFAWQPDFHNRNWTLQLLPLYATFYLDDEKLPQVVLLHGQTGKIHGSRRASMKRGQRVSLVILAAAVVLFILSLLLVAVGRLQPAILDIGWIGLVLALIVGLGAIVPVATAAWFNHQQKG